MTKYTVDKHDVVHMVEMEPRDRDTYETWMWCENRGYRWQTPPIVTRPVTCLACLGAVRPEL